MQLPEDNEEHLNGLQLCETIRKRKEKKEKKNNTKKKGFSIYYPITICILKKIRMKMEKTQKIQSDCASGISTNRLW